MSIQYRLSPPERLGECDSLIADTLQMQHNHQVLAKYITAIKRQLDDLTEQFNNRPELQQIANLQDALAEGHQQLGEDSAASEVPVEVIQTEVTEWVEEIAQPIHAQSYEYQLVFDRSESRSVLREALCKSQERLIIVCPWLNRNSIDADLLQQFRDCLNRNCRIDIGWGYLSERSRLGIGWRYDALKDLRQLEQDYPSHFKLKLLGTHEKFLVCDCAFAMLGSHNMLTSSAQSAEREAGIRTTDPQIIQGLINRFDGAEMQRQDTDEMTAGFVSLDDAEVDTPDIGYQSDVSPVNTYDIELDEDEDSQEPAINAEEFLRRYEAGERDFTGINLAGANLSSSSLKDINLSKANLTKANLAKANLSNINLSGTKLTEANLLEAILNYANLTGADLRSAELGAAQLTGAKLVGTNLNGAGLIQANLERADLSGANLSYTNFTAASLAYANLMKANLKGTNLAAANLTGSNLRKAEFDDKTRLTGADLDSVNLAGQNLQEINLSGVNLSNANLCGACLCASNLSGANLTSANLCGADLSSANLEKANLKGVNLSGANLGGAKYSGAIVPSAGLRSMLYHCSETS